jgi:flavin reductase (DIM6/NTAB) family NADH-FMN oxidoreductase RutF
MPSRHLIPIEKFTIKPFHLLDVQSLLLTSGDLPKYHFNAMTIGWGSFGYIWRRPFVQVVVRPVRYTFEFMEKYDTFTLCAFPPQYHEALQLLGSKSGRDLDKIAASGLTPLASTKITAPGYEQASLILECRKIYWADLNSDHFLDPGIELNYPQKDYHRSYFGEILAIFGTESFEG